MPALEDAEFPGNIVAVLKSHIVDENYAPIVLGRPMRPTDPNGSVAVTPRDWAPIEHNLGQWDPAISRYVIQIESMVRHTSEEEAIALHNRLAKVMRLMLYRDVTLRARLTGLSESSLGLIERLQRFGVETQRFTSNDVGPEFVFYAVVNLWVETEIV